MKTLIIHDDNGYVLSVRKDVPSPREPIGVPFLWAEIPEGKRIKVTDGIGVDVSVIPHQVILEDIPSSEIDLIRIEAAQTNAEMIQLIMMMSGGGAK